MIFQVWRRSNKQTLQREISSNRNTMWMKMPESVENDEMSFRHGQEQQKLTSCDFINQNYNVDEDV
jgi:hypothetical protein